VGGCKLKQLFLSPFGSVYFGNGKPLKDKPNVSIVTGEKIDVTQSFYEVLLQKFPPGETFIIRENEVPKFEITIKESEKCTLNNKQAGEGL
jgi:hypothetical protein